MAFERTHVVRYLARAAAAGVAVFGLRSGECGSTLLRRTRFARQRCADVVCVFRIADGEYDARLWVALSRNRPPDGARASVGRIVTQQLELRRRGGGTFSTGL